MRCKTCYDIGIHVKNTASLFTVKTNWFFVVLSLLEFLQLVEQFVCCVCWTCQKWLVAVIRCVVFLNEVTNVNFFLPKSSVESFPGFLFCHKKSPKSFIWNHLAKIRPKKRMETPRHISSRRKETWDDETKIDLKGLVFSKQCWLADQPVYLMTLI